MKLSIIVYITNSRVNCCEQTPVRTNTGKASRGYKR